MPLSLISLKFSPTVSSLITNWFYWLIYSEEGNPVVDQLIKVDSDESMDDDVFDEDQEVCEVMRAVAGNSSPPRASSPLTLHHHSSSYHSRSSQVCRNLASGVGCQYILLHQYTIFKPMHNFCNWMSVTY